MKLLFIIVGCCCTAVSLAQPGLPLQQRLHQFMEANRRLDFDTVIAYTYPKLFTLVPRDEVKESLVNAFENDQVQIGLDSLKLDSVYPVFSMQGGSYAKIRYSMKMTMHVKNRETDSSKRQEQNEAMLAAMQTQLGKEQVSLDTGGNIIMHVTALMLAAKDKYAKEWCFVNLKDGDPIVSQLFSKEIIDKCATYH